MAIRAGSWFGGCRGLGHAGLCCPLRSHVGQHSAGSDSGLRHAKPVSPTSWPPKLAVVLAVAAALGRAGICLSTALPLWPAQCWRWHQAHACQSYVVRIMTTGPAVVLAAAATLSMQACVVLRPAIWASTVPAVTAGSCMTDLCFSHHGHPSWQFVWLLPRPWGMRACVVLCRVAWASAVLAVTAESCMPSLCLPYHGRPSWQLCWLLPGPLEHAGMCLSTAWPLWLTQCWR